MSFDQVAAIYDATRGLPEGVGERVAACILDATHADGNTRVLELGIGTGRIGLPLAASGAPYTGVDISEAMMDVLRAKAAENLPNLTLVNADVTYLPFGDASFDVVLTVHLLHLVSDWRAALAEARRVTMPEGYFVMGHNNQSDDDAYSVLRRQWATFVREAGGELRPANGSWDAVDAELTTLGCQTAVYRAAWWETEMAPSELLDQQRSRTYSHSWNLPDDLLEAVYQRMVAFATECYADLDKPRTHQAEFLLSVSRWPAEVSVP